MISGQTINAQYKYKNAFDFKPYATFIFAGNQMPETYDQSHGYYRRLIIVKFEKQFLKGDPRRRNPEELKAALISEKEEIVATALRLYRAVQKQGCFSENELTEEAKEEYRLDNEPVRQFVNELLTKATPTDDQVFIETGELNARYEAWWQLNGTKRQKVKVLRNAIKAQISSYRYSTIRLDGKPKTGHIGIRFKKALEMGDEVQDPAEDIQLI